MITATDRAHAVTFLRKMIDLLESDAAVVVDYSRKRDRESGTESMSVAIDGIISAVGPVPE